MNGSEKRLVHLTFHIKALVALFPAPKRATGVDQSIYALGIHPLGSESGLGAEGDLSLPLFWFTKEDVWIFKTSICEFERDVACLTMHAVL